METLNPRRVFGCAMLLLASSIAPTVAADTFDMAAAKKEGKVVWYCSVPIETAQKVANLFEQKTGIKVELFRSGGSAILRRFQQESEAGKGFVAVITQPGAAGGPVVAKKGMLGSFQAARFDKGA